MALIDKDDQHHQRCVEALGHLPARPLLISWPCLVEAMYLLWRAGGEPAQDELWSYLADGLVYLHQPSDKEWERLRQLMAQYRDIPMDFADASLVAAAEVHGLHQIFTIDPHFHAYRISDKHTFQVVP